MVRLKQIRRIFYEEAPASFNSSMVRLKRRDNTGSASNSKFQFLYGAIKTVYITFFRKRYSMFQFLYGAIKTPKPDNPAVHK